MEKETDKSIDRSTVVLEDDGIGAVQIADDVVAVIASLAAAEVDGIYLAGNMTNEFIGKVGKKGVSKGVKVDVLGGNVSVEMVITMEFGRNIPAVCRKVQEKVKAAIENMTGLTCSDVNIRIAGVNTKKDK
ncbi:MAG: Asp23/Gls24 family envelope stress response protein [Lachnospiraceae bacterium]|nr:Asp23/Gls24 family envelope stress response protein [Lachnospiraceae bacterium]